MTRKNFSHLFSNDTYKDDLKNIFEEYIDHESNKRMEDYFDGVEVTKEEWNYTYKNIKKEIIKECKEFIYLEMLFYFHHVTFKRKIFLVKDPFAMFSNHEEKLYKGLKYDEKYLKRTVFLMKNIYTKEELKFIIKRYNFIPEEYRLFSFSTGKKTEVSFNPLLKFDKTDRKKVFKDIINDSTIVDHFVKKTKNKILPKEVLLKGNQVISFQYDKETKKSTSTSTEIVHVFGKAENLHKKNKFDLFPMTQLIKERESEKKGLKDLKKIRIKKDDYKEMDMIHHKSWEQRYDDLSIQPIDQNGKILSPKPFSFERVNYALGPLGSGKSTLSMGMIYRLVKEGKKIFIPVADTQLGFDLKEELREIGIENVAIFIGKSDIKDHRDTFILNNAKKYRDAIEFVDKRKNDLDILDNTCIVRGKMNVDVNEKRHPCSNIRVKEKNGKEKIYYCPFYERCGAHTMYSQMIEADVWIGSYEAFLQTKCPYQWDKYERTFYELAILWSDLVIIDEVDIAQVRMDDSFKNDLSVVIEDNKGQIDNFFVDYLTQKGLGVSKKQDHDNMVYVFGTAASIAHSVSRYMFTYILNKPKFFRSLSKKIFTPYQLLYLWLEEYTVQPVFHKIDERLLADFRSFFTYDVPSFSSESDELRIAMERIHTSSDKLLEEREKEINDLINQTIQNLSIEFGFTLEKKSDETELERNRMFEFILFFYKFEHATQYLRAHYKEYTENAEFENNEKIKLDFIFPQNPHSLYAPDSLTENIYAYKFSYDRHTKKLEQIYYFGVGRNLMYKMDKSFEYIEPHEKPALLFLSATSYSPMSSRFHLQIQPNWLIKNKNQANQKLNCYLSFFRDNKGDVLTISGERDEITRQGNIRKIAQKMVSTSYLTSLIQELEERKEQEYDRICHDLDYGETEEIKEKAEEAMVMYQQEKRGVIGIATSSFQNAEIFTKALIEAGFPPEKIKTLYSSKKDIERQDYHISKNEIYDLHKENIDVFVFVWKSIDRGFNILRGEGSNKSLLSKIIFLNRPHPKPGDFSESIMFLHGFQTEIDAKISGLYHSEALGKIHQLANAKIEEIFSKKLAWSRLGNEDRSIYGYNEFIPIAQTKGRGFRGGTDLDVYYVDGKFAEKTVAENKTDFIDKKDTSILAAWKEVLNSSTDPLKRELYGVFEDGLNKIDVTYY